MNIKHLFIDANILVKNYNFNNEDIIQLIKLKDFFKIQVCISEVVYDECIGNYNEDIVECHNPIKQEVQKYKNLLVNINKTKFDSEKILTSLMGMSAYYKPKLDDFISKNKFKKIPYPTISHEVIVKKTYEKKLPFGNAKCSEKGYKDFLILSSISEYNKKIPPNEDILIYSKNLSDFVNGDQKNIKDRILPVEAECDVRNLYITSSLSSLLAELTKSFKSHTIDISKYQETMSNDIGEAIINNITLYDDLYGDLFFEPKDIKNKVFSLSDVNSVLDEESEYCEIRGKIKIQFDCDFILNSFTFDENNYNFIYRDKVLKAITSKGYTNDDLWEMNFYDFSYCRVFDFTYTDFEYDNTTSPYPLKDLDTSLMLIPCEE